MKKLLFTILGMALTMGAVAEPAHPEPYLAHNADGTTVTINLVGDEFYHFNTTSDGYTVLKNMEGNFVYADKRDGKLVPTSIVAHDEAERSASERALLATLTKHMTDETGVSKSKQTRARRDTRMRAERSFDPATFRGLVILVNFNDRQFTRSDANSFFTRLLNEKNYSGYTNEDGSYSYYGSIFTGSVSDYFSDNTMGVFTPQFDVVGPITVDVSCMQDDNMGGFSEVFKQVVALADSQIDYSQYDNDHDGVIDLIYFIAAGFGSSYSGNNSQYLWPHAYYLWGNGVNEMDGVWPGRYACSVEFYGWEDDNYGHTHDGIGTICHEFSHCLGLPDLYDTDYGQGGGQSHVPGKWDIMSGGGSLNYSRCPAGYSLYDRYATGFANPPVITEVGDYTLRPIGDTNEGFILPSPNTKEKFLFENRQRSSKWDAYIPGSGMLVARMDSTNAQVWQNNKVNCNPSHNYYELLRAGLSNDGDNPSDPFPGTANVTEISGDDSTNPNLLTWDQQANEFNIKNINSENRVISFTVEKSLPPLCVIEDFESMPETTSTNETGVPGVFSTWTFSNSNVVAPGSDYCNGLHGVAMKRPGFIAMEMPTPYVLKRVTFKIHNSASTTAQVFLQSSSNGGTTWETVSNGSIKISAQADELCKFNVEFNQPVQLRIYQSTGSTSRPIYIDDITLYYTDLYETTNYPLTVGDVQVNNFNAPRVVGDGITGTVSYNPETQTLTLDGATINGTTHGITSEVDSLTINVVGDNMVNSADNVDSHCIVLSRPTTISGDGTLNAYGYRGVQMASEEATMLTVGGNVTLVAEGAQIGLAGYYKVRSKNHIDYYSALKVKDNATIRTIGHSSYTTINWVDMIFEDDHAIVAPKDAFYDPSIKRIAVPYGEYDEMVDKWVIIEKVNPAVPGDVNGDGIVSGADVTALYNVLLDGATVNGNADVNGDTVVSGADVTALYNLLLTN